MGHTHDSHFTVTNVIYLCLEVKFTFKALNGLITEDLQIAKYTSVRTAINKNTLQCKKSLFQQKTGFFQVLVPKSRTNHY